MDVIGPSEPARWERGRYVTDWVRCIVEEWGRFGPTYRVFDRRWVRTEDGWDEETRELWEMEHDSR